MSSVVPFVAAAFLGPVGVALVTTAFAVTGMSAKIDKAAANVFGEDLVKVANIAGMAYGIYNGGFDLSSGSESVSSEFLASKAADVATDSASMAASAAADLAPAVTDMSGSIAEQLASAAGGGAAEAVSGVAQAASGGESVFNLGDLAAKATEVAAGAPKATPSMADLGDEYFRTANQTSVTPVSSTATPQLKTPGVTPPDYNLSQLAGENTSSGMTSQNMLARQGAPVSESFLEKLTRMATDPKTGEIKNSVITLGGDTIKGLAGGYSAAKQREQYDAELRKRDATANLGGAGWRQTK